MNPWRTLRWSEVCLRVLLLSTVTVAGGVPTASAAQNVQPPATVAQELSLESAVQKAVEWHPSVDRAIASLSARGQEIREAESGYYPQVSGGIEPGMSVVGGTTWRPRANLSASQMLYDFGKVSSTVASAKAGEKMSRAELLMAVDSLARDTSYAVIEVQRNRALLAVAQEQLASLAAINDRVQLRVQRGASPRSDGTQAEARIRSAEVTILQITTELQRWQGNLQFLIGAEGDVNVAVDAPAWLPRACFMDVPDRLEVPAIMQAHAQRDRAESAYYAACADGKPRVSFDVNMDTDLRDPLRSQNDVRVGIKVSSNLYQGGDQRARERGSLHELRAAEAALVAARLEMERSLAEARVQTSNLAERIEAIADRKWNMQDTRMLYRMQYFDVGTRTLIDLLNAEQELHQARFEEVNAEHDMRRFGIGCLHQSGAMRDVFELTGLVLHGVAL